MAAAAISRPDLFDHVANFAFDDKTQYFFKWIKNGADWMSHLGVTEGLHPVGKAADTVQAALEIPNAINEVNKLRHAEMGLTRKAVSAVTSTAEAVSKAVKFAMKFFAEAMIAPWAIAASALGLYNCADLGQRSYANWTTEAAKEAAARNGNLVKQHAMDVAKYVCGFALNALGLAMLVGGIIIQAPVMIVLASLSLTCTTASYYFKGEAKADGAVRA